MALQKKKKHFYQVSHINTYKPIWSTNLSDPRLFFRCFSGLLFTLHVFFSAILTVCRQAIVSQSPQLEGSKQAFNNNPQNFHWQLNVWNVIRASGSNEESRLELGEVFSVTEDEENNSIFCCECQGEGAEIHHQKKEDGGITWKC